MPLKTGYSRETFEHNYAQMKREGHPHTQALAAAFKEARKSFFDRYPHGALPQWLTPKDGKRMKNPCEPCAARKQNPVSRYHVFAEDFRGHITLLESFPNASLANEYASYVERQQTGDRITVKKGAPEKKRKQNPASKAGKHAAYLFEHYQQSGAALADRLFNQIIKQEKLTVGQKTAVTQKFQELLKSSKRKSNPVPPSRKVQQRNAEDLYSRFTGHEAAEHVMIDKPVLPDVMLVVGDIDFIGYTTVRDGVTEKYIHKFTKKCRPLFSVSHDGKQLFMLGGSYDFTELGIVDKT